MAGWDVALALELLAVVFGFILWFKAARAEAGPKRLAKVVAIIIVIVAALLAVCTVTRAFISAGEYKTGMMGWGYGKCGMHGGPGGTCPNCGGPMGPAMGGMMGGPGKMHGPGPGKGPCPMMADTAAKAGTAETE